MLPGAASWTAGSDPAQDQLIFNNSTIPGGNDTFTRLTWNSANNSVLGTRNVPAGQSIKVRFKLIFGDCEAVGAPVINRQRLAGYDCRGTSGDRFWYVRDNYWSTDHWPKSPDHPWVKLTEILKPAVTLEKSVDKQEASPGEELLYRIKIKNTGNGGAKNFKLSDAIPAGTALVPNSVTNGVYSWM